MSFYPTLKYTIHLITLWSLIIIIVYGSICYQSPDCDIPYNKPRRTYETILIYIITAIQCLVILPMPQIVCNVLGLTLYNPFPGEIKIEHRQPHKLEESPRNDKTAPPASQEDNNNNNNSNHFNNGNYNNYNNNNEIYIFAQTSPPSPAQQTKPSHLYPHLCFRVVTRGLYPELVRDNVHDNYRTCLEAGLSNFSIEVVTDKEISLSNHPTPTSNNNNNNNIININSFNSRDNERIRELVVPKTYESSTRTMFKARALQYALERDVSPVKPGDYIIHLDEETMLTRNAINGILNFALNGKHAFGQGLITYANLEIVNYFTTLADSYRVADDMGKLRFQLACLHRPIFGWKGSYVVTKYEAELDVSFDHGPDGSIAEDCYFSMVACTKGYTFDFIQGEMYERSPFTIMDLVRQRKRWIQGIWLVVHSSKIPIKTKFFLAMSHYAWLSLVITTLSFLLGLAFALPTPRWLQPFGSFCLAVTLYMYLFGLVKSFDLKNRPIHLLIAYSIGQVLTLPLNIIVENLAVILGLTTSKYKFYIVKKDVGHNSSSSSNNNNNNNNNNNYSHNNSSNLKLDP